MLLRARTFIRVETLTHQAADLLAQMVLEFRDIHSVDRLTTTRETSPLVELILKGSS